ncbi:YaeQ family protein [Geopsychrobacter electrodiphilus]|uniref:YaeQ family protein n=1 Tax=Geopsychrobacter electrodiphilus TaxID=225196 RepID=UPI00036DEDEA|nr:YaeQ family protein [Geopsychrobacter electrodiphilus]
MALGATIFKAELQISDMNRNYYGEHLLTLARHPSETDERMMVRLLAFALHADERLSFTRGLCADEEPDLWLKSYTDEIEQWIDVGQPDERRLRKACGRAQQVTLYLYGGRGADLWWQKNAEKLQRLDNLTVLEVPDAACKEMTCFVQRSMQLQCTVQDGEIWLTAGDQTRRVTLQARKSRD